MTKTSVFHDRSIVGSPALHLLCMAVLLFIFWMLLSGNTQIKFIIYGILTSVIASWAVYPLLLIPNADGTKKYFLMGISPIKLINYFFWLMWQLILANIDVIKATVRPELKIDPKIVRFYYHTDNPIAMVVLANSITLTPGTVTLNMTKEGLYEVHALTEGAAAGLIDGGMQRKVAWLYDEPCNFDVVKEEA